MTLSEGTKTQIALPSDREIVVTRSFDVPRELVWRTWTQAQHLQHWWGPKGWTLPVCEVDLRVGGSWFYCMQGPDDMQSCGKSIYNEIEKPIKLVMTDSFADSEGNPLEGMPVAHTTVEFIEEDGKTTVVSTTAYETKAERDKVIEMGMEEGIKQTLDRLDSYLKTVE